MTNEKVYKVLVAFTANNLSYEVDQKYELDEATVANLAPGTVELVEPKEPEKPVTTPADNTKPASEEIPPAKEPAKPWAGNHTVGRDEGSLRKRDPRLN